MKTTKVFGIGFQKTGTTSLGKALEVLGYRVHGVILFREPDPAIAEKARQRAFEVAEAFDAFQDMPWPLFYREFDQRYPQSKFILTLRSSDDWIRSMVRHFGRRTAPLRASVYGAGCPRGNEARYVERYERHNREVLDYFRDRPDDLLVLNLTEGDGWEKLCPFLNKDIPAAPFPIANKARDRRLRRMRRYVKHPVTSLIRLVKSYR